LIGLISSLTITQESKNILVTSQDVLTVHSIWRLNFLENYRIKMQIGADNCSMNIKELSQEEKDVI
jgi:hypothetical protein|tara:strand:+ start:244 stop:441 length:198 start_codon:yes stop_codon:yes gene_type:complete